VEYRPGLSALPKRDQSAMAPSPKKKRPPTGGLLTQCYPAFILRNQLLKKRDDPDP